MIRTMLLASLLVSTAVTSGSDAVDPLHDAEGSVVTRCPATGSPTAEIVAVHLPSDPTADSSEAIQHAIDAAARSGGATVLLPKGRMNLHHPIVIKENVGLKGAGASTVLKASGRFLDSRGPHGGHPVITTNGASNVTISDLTADQSGDVLDGNSTGGRLSEYMIDIRRSGNVKVERVRTRNPFTYSIAVVGSNRFCVRDNYTTVGTHGKYDQLDGIHILDSHTGLVEGNHVDQGASSDGDDGLAAHVIGGTVHDVTYNGNIVRGGRHGAAMQLAIGDKRIYGITITNNRFWGSPAGVRTGYYGGSAPVHNVVVKGNLFVDNSGPSVDFFGRLSHINVTHNKRCRSGTFNVDAGRRNRVGGNVISC